MKRTVLTLLVLLLAASPAYPGAADSLRAARDLYAAAAYEEALAMLNRLNEAAGAPDVVPAVDPYRAFCMFALGRTDEAESVAESIIRRDPLTQLDSADASPRIQEMFARVRQRVLPSLIRERFRTAKAGFDRKDFPAAEPFLIEAGQLIAQAQELGVEDEGLADLSVLVDGFLQLTRLAAPEQAEASSAAAEGVDLAQRPPDAQLTSGPAAPAGRRVYSVADDGVSPPTAISQDMPPISSVLARVTRSTGKTGIIDVVIDETGEVVDVMVRVSIDPSLNRVIAQAARRWKYQPAVKEGIPVRFVKSVQIVVR
jgi:tetratricopeptide (TPR) repeat protein